MAEPQGRPYAHAMATPALDLAAQRGVALPLTTARLTLSPYTCDDAEALFAYRSLPEVRTWLGTWDESARALDERLRAAGSTFVVRAGDTVIGDVQVTVQDAWSHAAVAAQARATQAELAWTFDPAQHGRGYATEAVREAMRFCIEDLGLRRLEAFCFADNLPSVRLMERVGMRREGHYLGESLHAELGWIDAYGYALLAEEWRVRQ